MHSFLAGIRGRLRQWLGALFAPMVVVTLVLVGAEGVLHLQGFGQLVIYQPDDSLYWRPRPRQDAFTKIGHKPVRINSLGLRGAEIQEGRPPGVIRILCLGDSRTFGWGLEERETYAKVTERQLHEELPAGLDVEVLNAGVNAWSYEQMETFLDESGPALDPAVVVVDGANLWGEFSRDRSEEFKSAFRRRVWLKNLLRRSALYHYVMEVRLQKYYEKIRDHAMFAMPRPDEERFQREAGGQGRMEATLERIVRMAEMKGVEVILLHIPRQNESENEESRLVLAAKRQVSARTGARLLELAGDFSASTENLFLEADPIHPNAAGNLLIGRRLAEMIAGTEAFARFSRVPPNAAADAGGKARSAGAGGPGDLP